MPKAGIPRLFCLCFHDAMPPRQKKLDLECTRSPTIQNVDEEKRMKIGELAARTGLTAHTIRYYERIGLIPYAVRDETGQRAYDRSVLEWIGFLGRLKTTGMPIQGMLRYAQLRAAGKATERERGELLAAHREAVRAQVAELQACLLVLDNKIEGYSHAMQRNENARNDKSDQRLPAGKPSRKRQAHALGD
ncbi:MerR family transcriptional regulator [Paraburkholderia acidiphila]|nr:MerR family transcriptional regulator [Paraburkholderia acidiphila]